MEARVQTAVRRKVSQPRVAASLDEKTSVTIGIPAYNEEGRIGLLIRDLLDMKDPRIIEIIVNASGSTDGTVEEVEKASPNGENDSCAIKLIDSKGRQGKAGAIDEILRNAVGEVIVFIDADTRIGENCINEIVEPFSKQKNLGVVSGNILPLSSAGKDTSFFFMSQFQRELHHQLCMSLVSHNAPVKVNGTFFAVRKEVVKCLPHYVVSDDEYISWCAQNAGYKVTYAPEAKVYTMDPPSLKGYLSKRRRILGGHFLIKNTLNYVVPTTRVSLLFPEFGRLAIKYRRKFFYLIVMASFELVSRLLAFNDAFSERVSPYYRIDSAKFPVKNKE